MLEFNIKFGTLGLAPNLTLEEGATYYITVRSRDNAGNWVIR